MTDEEIRNQYRFTHHALVCLYKLCVDQGDFKNGVSHQGIDEGEVHANGIFDQVEAVLRGEHPTLVDEKLQGLWQDLLDKDDRTSPGEYPDMALITFDELKSIVDQATSVG